MLLTLPHCQIVLDDIPKIPLLSNSLVKLSLLASVCCSEFLLMSANSDTAVLPTDTDNTHYMDTGPRQNTYIQFLDSPNRQSPPPSPPMSDG